MPPELNVEELFRRTGAMSYGWYHSAITDRDGYLARGAETRRARAKAAAARARGETVTEEYQWEFLRDLVRDMRHQSGPLLHIAPHIEAQLTANLGRALDGLERIGVDDGYDVYSSWLHCSDD